MRRFIKVLSAVLMLAAFITISGPARAADTPKIEVTPPTYDLGNIGDDVKSKATFTIKNAGTADLVIYDVKTSCGCTVANISSKKIAPGQAATIEAIYDSRNAAGAVHKFINIQNNDPAAQYVSVAITGNVTPKPAPDITLSAYNAQNIQLSKGGSDIRTIRVTSSGQEPLIINELNTTPGLSAEIDGAVAKPASLTRTDITIKPGESREIKVTTAPRTEKGAFQEVLTIRSNAKRKPVVAFISQGLVQ